MYAVIERERRFRVRSLPDGVTDVRRITDRYIAGTRMRLREVVRRDGSVVRKLGHKVRLDGGRAIAHTSIQLDDAEWELLTALPAGMLRKTRHIVERDGLRLAVDEFEDGTLLAEIDDGEGPRVEVPDWLDVVEDVTDDEAWTGAMLCRSRS